MRPARLPAWALAGWGKAAESGPAQARAIGDEGRAALKPHFFARIPAHAMVKDRLVKGARSWESAELRGA